MPRGARAGFSMLETVLALAVLSLAAALVTTRASLAVDQIAVHAAFQDFQTGLLTLRARAFARDQDLRATPELLPLPQGWSFRSEAPLTAEAAGVCTGGEVDLLRGDRVRARLVPSPGGGCRYLRAR